MPELQLETDSYLLRVTDPEHAVTRVYRVTVRGRVTRDEAQPLNDGIVDRGQRLSATSVTIRKASGRETYLIIELTEGKNREVRRLCAAIGHEVTSLARIGFGGLTLGDLPPGRWRELSREDIRRTFPSFAIGSSTADPASSASPRRRRSAR